MKTLSGKEIDAIKASWFHSKVSALNKAKLLKFPWYIITKNLCNHSSVRFPFPEISLSSFKGWENLGIKKSQVEQYYEKILRLLHFCFATGKLPR